MNTVGIVGLGLIGGSMAKTIRANTDYRILGYDLNEVVIEQSVKEGVLSAKLTYDNAKNCDIFIVALYPKDVVKTIRDYSIHLKKGAIVVDCTGVKGYVCRELSKELLQSGIFFVGGHPMAGKEVAGYDNADSLMYTNASMILCRDSYTNEEAYKKAGAFFRKVGFKSIKETTPEIHDRVIAYTSQMAHVVSNSYIKSPTLKERCGFSAGSFKDMTRVAYLNENMWTDLFLENKDALVEELDIFINNVTILRDAINAKDADKVREILRLGRELKEQDEEVEACHLH